MASYRILPAVSSGGGEFGEALGQGVSAYRKGVTRRRKKEEEEEKRSAYHKAALESEEEEKTEAVLKDPGKTIKRAMLGLGDPEVVGPAFGVDKPKPVETLHGPIIGEADQDYGQVVQRALKERFAPNVEQGVIARDFLGLPQEKAPRRTTFNEDARKAVAGEMSWDELKKIHPEKYEMIDALELEFPKAPLSPEQKFLYEKTGRKAVLNKDKSISSERTITVEMDGKHYVLPTIIDGKQLSEKDAVDYAVKNKSFLGSFDTAEEAKTYAENRSRQSDLLAGGSGRLQKSRISDVAANFPDAPQGKVLVISPEGQKGYIPTKNLQKALKNGFKVAK